MIIIDTNALVLLLVGLIDTKLINNHRRTSIYDEEDFYDLVNIIGDISNLIVIPNIWTEVDNLLNNSSSYKYIYIERLTETIRGTTEKYLESHTATNENSFYDLGLTDSLILQIAKSCKLLITSDSQLSDYAIANGIKVYDLVQISNQRIRKQKI
jgi:rRNA-processing protein FCF1